MAVPFRHISRRRCGVSLLLLLLLTVLFWSLQTEFRGLHLTIRRHINIVPERLTVDRPSPGLNSTSTVTKTAPTTHVRFLKVHKAGSTTIQNIMFRFALRHNLDILLPKSNNYLLNKQASIAVPSTGHFDVFACHTTYSKRLFDSILPPDSINIGIVRSPPERMISAAYYYRDVFKFPYLRNIPKDKFIHNLVQHPEIYDRHVFSYTRNSMGKDFGFSAALNPNDTEKISAYLQFLDKEFPLVMVMERFDESLVLMRRVLNWSVLDIIYLRANSHLHQYNALTPVETTKLKNTCFLDYAIYDFFLKKFEERVKTAGDDFLDEVQSFNTTLATFKTFCESNTDDTLQIQETRWTERIRIPRKECGLVKKLEMPFINELRERQIHR